MKQHTLHLLITLLQQHQKLSYSDIIAHFPQKNESTITRNLNLLLKSGKITKKKIGKNTFYTFISAKNLKEYFNIPFFDRPKVTYHPDFLEKYIPNETSFLGADTYQKLKKQYLDNYQFSTYDYTQNIREIENLIIDLSYTSSKLEGNTYSYLDTEVLIKYNEAAEGKSQVETQMILNHKTAIKYVIDHRKEIGYTHQEFMNIHALLAKHLLIPQYVGTIRTGPVSIGSSAYSPLDNKFQLEEVFTLFLQKLNQIRNPFEQALFILVFISYFQLFMDGNKRTARIAANIPLIKNGLGPASFLQVKDRDYIDAILAVYELNTTDFIRDIFVENYLMNRERYR